MFRLVIDIKAPKLKKKKNHGPYFESKTDLKTYFKNYSILYWKVKENSWKNDEKEKIEIQSLEYKHSRDLKWHLFYSYCFK